MVLVKEFTKAFAQGALAEIQGRGVKANPYAKGTDESHAWAAGWYTARDGRDQ
jgi:ribosome modulation factor